jgi:hypothetical protein
MSERNNDATSNADREIIIARVLDAPRELVFTAWTDPTHVAHWWGHRRRKPDLDSPRPVPRQAALSGNKNRRKGRRTVNERKDDAAGLAEREAGR